MQFFRIIGAVVFLLIGFRILHERWPEFRVALEGIAREAQTASAQSGNAGNAQPAQRTWALAYKRDEMSDEKALQATSSQWAAGGGYFSITAECDEARRTGVALTIDYFAGSGQDAHYMLNGRGDVPMEIRLDNQTSKSLSTSTDFNNEANLAFINDKADVGGGAAGLVFGIAAAFGSAGRPHELATANTLRVRLSLTDGRTPIVVVSLQDPDLQRFFARCGFGRGTQTRMGSQTTAVGSTGNGSAAATTPDASPSFQNGLTDRQTWERWIGTLSADALAGATFWAGERSKGSPGSCNDGPGQSSAAYRQGCASARQFLTPTDLRRKSEPDYRRGWNTN